MKAPIVGGLKGRLPRAEADAGWPLGNDARVRSFDVKVLGLGVYE